MMIASGFCWTAALMIGTCDDAPASVGPGMRFEPPSSFSASSTPECSNSSYGLPSCFGIETVFRPFLIGAFGSAVRRRSSSTADDDCCSTTPCSFLVSPQAASDERRQQRERGEQRAEVRGRSTHDASSWVLWT